MQVIGKTFCTMITQGLGAIVNIILDPILILGLFGLPKMGIVGAAIATATGQIVAMMLIGLCVLQVFPKQLLKLFNASNELISIGVSALKTISLSFIFAGFCIVLSTVFQALGNGMLSLMVSVCRQLVVLLPTAYLLSKTGNLNIVWWEFSIAEIVSVFLSYIGLRYVYKKEIKPLDDEYEIKSLNSKKEVNVNNETNIF